MAYSRGHHYNTAMTETTAHDVKKVLSPKNLAKVERGEDLYTFERATQFIQFKNRIDQNIANHPILTNNTYTTWFRKGEINEAQMKDFLIQFSVFSNLFLLAQLKKVINADSIESMRASKEILANELGVIFNRGQKVTNQDVQSAEELVSAQGSIEGGTFRFKAAHFEWFYEIAQDFGLSWNDIGKRKHGSRSTLFFCDELSRLYGSENYETSQAASFAVENWAAAGFWKDLIEGLKIFKEKNKKNFSVAYFIHHNQIEQQHADHTQEELEEYYFEHPTLDEDHYIKCSQEMLAGIEAFWKGLDEQRISL
ncbi:MAG: hypothetical protein KDD52_05805 [Bdellovibrionales bacterium]|nr:hypothetical protein [Bdellovibrionales bacterium]